jgi:hypothetical protein
MLTLRATVIGTHTNNTTHTRRYPNHNTFWDKLRRDAFCTELAATSGSGHPWGLRVTYANHAAMDTRRIYWWLARPGGSGHQWEKYVWFVRALLGPSLSRPRSYTPQVNTWSRQMIVMRHCTAAVSCGCIARIKSRTPFATLTNLGRVRPPTDRRLLRPKGDAEKNIVF